MIHSFLLIGQSNMAGRGFIEEVPELDDSRIFILRNGRWQKMFRPITPDRSFAGVSLAEKFAELYSKKHDVDVGLICCADGGTRLDQWEVGGLLYDNAVSQAKLAQRTSTIAGVLWHQGESDCDDELYPLYDQKFEKIMTAFREDLDLYDVPFLLGGLGDYLKDRTCNPEMAKNYIFVNEALTGIASKHEMTGFVSAEGLTGNPDNLHFNSASLYEFGARYFEKYEKLFAHNKLFEQKVETNNLQRSEIELL